MSESKVAEARDDHLARVLANMHQVTVDGGITHLEALELHTRAMLGIAYDAKGNMTEALTAVQGYVDAVIKQMRTDAQPIITSIVEHKKLHRIQ